MVNLVFRGVVELPSDCGPVRALKFSMDRSTTTDFTLSTPDDASLSFTTDALTVRSDVLFYTSRFQGRLGGLVPVDYTPDSPPLPIPLPLVVFTRPDIQLVFVDSGVLETEPVLRIAVDPS